jgi:uncharacterized protein involved in type VI secretion and phage assembly
MTSRLVDSAAQSEPLAERRFDGVYVATVMDNRDQEGRGRVKICLPWMPEIEPWARVAVPFAGQNRGIYFYPQVDDEVLVAFETGDVRSPYIIGCLWSLQSRSPATEPADPTNLRMIRTPAGHEVRFDDPQHSIHITSCGGHKIHIDRDEMKLETCGGKAKIILNKDGNITIEAEQTLSLKAREINLEAEQSVTISGDNSVSIDGGQNCEIQASMVRIN